MDSQVAWNLVCRLFAGQVPVLRATLSPAEEAALPRLGKAIKSTISNQTYALCPYCQLQRGLVTSDGRGGRVCQCPECGPVNLQPQDLETLMLDQDWLRSKLRLAMGINSRDGIVELCDGVWRLGDARQAPIWLARDLLHVWRDPRMLEHIRAGRGKVRVIAPAHRSQVIYGDGVEWLNMRERFVLYGGGISFIETHGVAEPAARYDATVAVHGPFSEDFRYVTLADWPHGVIRCTEKQAAVFKALWSFQGIPVTADKIRFEADIDSDKPIDVFKVKTRDKDKPEVGGPLFAYRALVKVNRREGLYAMACAATSQGSPGAHWSPSIAGRTSVPAHA
jgi:hypothetical protein